MKKKIMMTISVAGVNVLGNTTNIMASPVSGVGVATSTGIPEIDNALNIIKALFIGLISTIGVIIWPREYPIRRLDISSRILMECLTGLRELRQEQSWHLLVSL